MKENDVIAIIIILLFIVLALIAFGIYRLVHMARAQGTVSEESGTGSGITDDEHIVPYEVACFVPNPNAHVIIRMLHTADGIKLKDAKSGVSCYILLARPVLNGIVKLM
ncbi:hypothetical protein F4813DRAFT_390711 [Daldinia decipiens]|uniref:uncharacterized protein n=1 Tax=Daldinia decipiens TaxID=326647 RepID=UPI0020C495F4|nr:uncharacterized protein F4813DRAFT_390711 [Daldinia decipiens]KAI1656342.1 hypothetical protein F4813DRAFT_390711 [Daldinia decipiens]